QRKRWQGGPPTTASTAPTKDQGLAASAGLRAKTCQGVLGKNNPYTGYPYYGYSQPPPPRSRPMLDRPTDTVAPAMKDQQFYQRLGRRIAEHRKALGLTQTDLAQELGVAQQTMAHYEGGTA